MINSIEIKNFTVFENVKIDFCDGVNVFIGENGTGKTQLLKLLYAASLEAGLSTKVKEVFGEDFNIEIPSVTVKSTPYQPIFIPAKDMLTHGRLEKDYAQRKIPFDRTLIDILNKAGVSELAKIDDNMAVLLDKISQIIGGEIVYESDRYYIKSEKGGKIGFDMVAEGHKKFGLIYRLIKTGYFQENSVLLWDEPEANLNPKLIPELVEILLALSRCGVQVFLATHNYLLTKFFEVRKMERDAVLYHSLYKTTDKGVLCESESTLAYLSRNSILEQHIKVYEEEVERAMA